MVFAHPAPDLHYAILDGVPIFLDVAQDRYFSLPAEPAAAFCNLIANPSSAKEARAKLAGVMTEADLDQVAAGPAAATRFTTPSWDTELDHDRRPHLLLTARAIVAILLSRARIAVFGLRGALAYVRLCRSAGISAAPDERRRIADAHRRADRWVSVFADCLTRATALSAALARAGIASDLVIGVKTLPFAAHSWVQIGDCVVNDRVERVLPFTPILIA